MKDILHNIVTALIFTAAAISCLISVWIAELIIIILRNRITYNRKIKAIDIDDTEKLDKERKKLKTRYLVFNNHIFIGYRICFI